MRRTHLLLALLSLLSVTAFAQIDPELLAGMKARAIGPAAMSGRVAAIDVVQANPNILYVGAATGGVWKSVDGGMTFTPVFDDQPVAAIGAIAINQRSPEIVWVGTGEGNPRNSVSVGNGIYKSIDGGRTWQHLGLEKTERIHRIVLHPTDPNIAWVAAMGQAWGQNADRGVFKTEDGGRTWKKVLYVDERTGATDLVIDPINPNKMFASMWEYRRWPWFFSSGGHGSGLYVTYDAGQNWKRYTEEDGLPKGTLGRIGIAISHSDPRVVYAIVEAEKSALIRSDDGGLKWRAVNSESDIAPRPFYFAEIHVDPADPNRVYNLWTAVSVSNDGGKSFQLLVPFSKVHPDYHAMWIDQNNADHVWLGNDGGIAESRDRAQNWRFVTTLPLGQYYHIAVDMDQPYHIYGGMQDNGSWRGPNTTWETAGIRNWDWQEVGFGDGFATAPIPSDSMTGYSMSQEGHLLRWNLRTGERKAIRPASPAGTELRFNWNAAMAVDPFNPDGIYFGSQFVHHSTDRGETWSTISPDLTTNNKNWQKQDLSGGITPDATGAENYTTIITIAPSPIEKGLTWAGTDDGRVQVTRDGGTTWASVESNIKGVPVNTWVPEIKASRHAAGTAFVVFDDHRRSNWTPYVYRTTDYGKTWASLGTKELRGYALSIEEDPVDANLLFLGTEFGLWFSTDAGRSWMKWTHGIPTVSVMGLAIHPRDHDLVVATHGRSAYIIDDIRPLRSLSAAIMSEPVHLFEVPPAQQFRRRQKIGPRFTADAEFRGDNEAYGALLTWSLSGSGLPHPAEETERARREKERAAKPQGRIPETGIPPEMKDIPKEPAAETLKQQQTGAAATAVTDAKEPKVAIEVADASGKVVRKFKAPAKLGMNRAAWDLRRDAFRTPPRENVEDDEFSNRSGPEMPAGDYTVTLKYAGKEAKQPVRVVADPRENIAQADRQAKWNAILRAGKVQETVTDAIERIRRTRADIDTVSARLKKPEGEEADPLVAAGARLKQRLDAIERRLWTPPNTRGIVAETDVMSKLQYPMGALQSSWDAPTAAQLAYLERAESVLREVLVGYNKLFAEDVARFRSDVQKQNIVLFPEAKPIEMP